MRRSLTGITQRSRKGGGNFPPPSICLGLCSLPTDYCIFIRVRYRPLSSEQLRAIYETNPTPAVKRLLWEIHRLRAAVLRANDLLRALDHYQTKVHPQAELAVVGLREAVKDEPVVKEDEARRLSG